MKKTLSILLILITAVATVFAGGEKEAATSSTTDKTVVEIWTNDRHDAEYFNKKIAEFNAANDEIEIKMTTIVDDYANMLVMAYTSGNAPDLFYMNARGNGFDLKTFVDAGMLEAYPTSLLEDPTFKLITDCDKHMVEGVNVQNGTVYGVFNVVRSGSRMIYNEDLVKAAGYDEFPTTLEGLVELADAVTKMGNGEYYGIATCASSQFERWLEHCCTKSGLFIYDFENGRFDFDGYQEPIRIAQQLFKNGSMFPGSNTQGVDAMRAQFANGTFAIWGNASQEAGVFTDQFPVEDFTWKTAELPTLDGGVHGVVDSKPQKGLFMFSSSKNKDAAWEVVKYLNSEDFVKGYIEMGYALPLSAYMQETVDMEKIGRLADFAPVYYEGLFPSVPTVTLAGDDFEKTMWNCIVNGTDPDKCVADLNKRYNEALEKDIKLGKTKRVVIKNFDMLHPNDNPITYLDK